MANGPRPAYLQGQHILQQFVHPFFAHQAQIRPQPQHVIPDEILDELISRFVMNIPEEERQDATRVCFQIELAHWFFVDNYCGEEKSDYWKELGHIKFLPFAALIFRRTPFLQKEVNNVEKIVQDFREYKQKVPTFGAILMDQDLSKVVLVQGFGGQWGFPKGKINKDEDPAVCAAREVMEETGYDSTPLLNRNHYIESCANERWTRLYIVRGVDPNLILKPHTRYEIKNIGWFPISEIPECKKDPSVITRPGFPHTAFHNVFPYIKRLRRWIDGKLTGKKDINFFRSNAPNRPDHIMDRVVISDEKGDRNRQLSGSGSSQSVGSGKSVNNTDPFSSSFNMANNSQTNTSQPVPQGTKYLQHPFQFQSPFSTPQKQPQQQENHPHPNPGIAHCSQNQRQSQDQPSSGTKTDSDKRKNEDQNAGPAHPNQNMFVKVNINPKRRLFTSDDDANDVSGELQSKMTKLKISPGGNSNVSSGTAVPVQNAPVPIPIKLESIFGIPFGVDSVKIKQEPNQNVQGNPIKFKLPQAQAQPPMPIVSLTSSATWLNFKLDTDQILGAMKSTSASAQVSSSASANCSGNNFASNSSKRRNRRR